jgi:hypothetical protein
MASQSDKAALLAQISSAAAGVKINNKDDVLLRAKKALH